MPEKDNPETKKVRKNGFPKKHSLYQLIFLRFFSSCCIVLAVCLLWFVPYYRTEYRAVTETAARQMRFTVREVEQSASGVQSILEIISQDTTFKKFAVYTNEDFRLNPKQIPDFRTNMLSASSIFNLCNDVFFYLDRSESVFGLSSRRYSGDLFDFFFVANNISKETFFDYVNFKGLLKTVILGDGRIWMMRACYNSELERVAVIIAELKIDAVVRAVREMFPQDYIVLARDETLLASTVPLSPDEWAGFREIGTNPEKMSSVRLGNLRFHALRQKVAGVGWDCFVLIPDRILYQNLRTFRFFALALVVTGALATVLVSSLLARRSYEPVKKLLALMQQEDKGNLPETYQSVVRALTKLQDDSAQLASRQEEEELLRTEKLVREVLAGEATYARVVERAFQDWVAWDENSVCCMALVHISCGADNHVFDHTAQGELTTESQELVGYVLKNVFEERVFAEFGGRMLVVDDLFFLCVPCTKVRHKELNTRLSDCTDFLRDTLTLKPTIVVSDCIEEVSQVPQVYATLRDELLYNLFWRGKEQAPVVVQLGNIEEYADKYSYEHFMQESGKLMNYLAIDDYVSAYRIIEEIIEDNFPKNRKYLQQNRYRMYGLIGAISVYLEIPESGLDDFGNYEERLYAVDNINEFKEVMNQLFERLIALKASKEASAPLWVEQVDEYIQENYADINLTVSLLADTFDVSVSHLSRTFKQFTGTGALDRIHEVRLKKAKELLVTGMSVEEVAHQTGYLDAKALRRAFTNYEGITPGKFRDATLKRDLA